MGFQQAAIVLGCFRCVAVSCEHKGCPGQCSGGIVAACGLRISDRDLQIASFEKMFIPYTLSLFVCCLWRTAPCTIRKWIAKCRFQGWHGHLPWSLWSSRAIILYHGLRTGRGYLLSSIVDIKYALWSLGHIRIERACMQYASYFTNILSLKVRFGIIWIVMIC